MNRERHAPGPRSFLPNFLNSQASERVNRMSSTANSALTSAKRHDSTGHRSLSTQPVENILASEDARRHASRMSRIDGCPECVTNAETPRTVHDAADGFTAYYRCHACGHAWATSWKD